VAYAFARRYPLSARGAMILDVARSRFVAGHSRSSRVLARALSSDRAAREARERPTSRIFSVLPQAVQRNRGGSLCVLVP
jgi:hypothetical protein